MKEKGKKDKEGREGKGRRHKEKTCEGDRGEEKVEMK